MISWLPNILDIPNNFAGSVRRHSRTCPVHRTLEGRRCERRHLPGPSSCIHPYLFQGDCYLRVTLCLTPGVSLHSTPGECVWVLFCLPLGASCFRNLGGRGRKSRKRKRAEIQPIIRRPDMAVIKPFQINILAPAFRLGNSFIIMISQPSEDTLVETQSCRTHTSGSSEESVAWRESKPLWFNMLWKFPKPHILY